MIYIKGSELLGNYNTLQWLVIFVIIFIYNVIEHEIFKNHICA